MLGGGERERSELERVFKALAHATRRDILVGLHAHPGQMTAGEIASRFACSWPTTSRHLRQLEEAGLVTVDRQGREWRYGLENARLYRVVSNWIQWFTPMRGQLETERKQGVQ